MLQLIRSFTVTLAILCAVPALAAGDELPAHSGFLGDDAVYARLQEVEIRKGVNGQRWIAPSLNLANYKSVLVADVVLYPEPEPGPQVSADTLQEISSYLTEKLQSKVAAVLKTTDTPGPGVLKMETAVTGVVIKTEGMKAYEVLPVAAVFGAFKASTGKRNRDVRVFVESRFLDSESGELLGAVIRQLEGEDLKGKKDKLTLEDMQASLDELTDDASNGLSAAMQASAE